MEGRDERSDHLDAGLGARRPPRLRARHAQRALERAGAEVRSSDVRSCHDGIQVAPGGIHDDAQAVAQAIDESAGVGVVADHRAVAGLGRSRDVQGGDAEARGLAGRRALDGHDVGAVVHDVHALVAVLEIVSTAVAAAQDGQEAECAEGASVAE